MKPRGFAANSRLVLLATAILSAFLSVAVRLVFLQVIDRGAILTSAGTTQFNELPTIDPAIQKYVDAAKTIGFAIVTFLAGLILFLIRKHFRFYYGLLEIATGIVTAASFRSEARVDMIFMIKILGGLYIVVRGLDNVSQALAIEQAEEESTTAPEQNSASIVSPR